MLEPIEVNLTMYRGYTFDPELLWLTGKNPVPVDLTGCQARMVARPTSGARPIVLDLTTGNSGIVLGGVTGSLKYVVPHSATALVVDEVLEYQTEVLFSNGDKRLLYKGAIHVLSGLIP